MKKHVISLQLHAAEGDRPRNRACLATSAYIAVACPGDARYIIIL